MKSLDPTEFVATGNKLVDDFLTSDNLGVPPPKAPEASPPAAGGDRRLEDDITYPVAGSFPANPLSLPRSVLTSQVPAGTELVIAFRTTTINPHSLQDETMIPIGPLYVVEVFSQPDKDLLTFETLNSPVYVTIPINKNINPELITAESVKCVFWDEYEMIWSSVGGEIQQDIDAMNDAEEPVTQITCKWNHLTEFAIAIEGEPTSVTKVVGETTTDVTVSGAQWAVIGAVVILGIILMAVTLTWKEEESDVVVHKKLKQTDNEIAPAVNKLKEPTTNWKSGGMKSSGLALAPDLNSSASSCKPEEDPF